MTKGKKVLIVFLLVIAMSLGIVIFMFATKDHRRFVSLTKDITNELAEYRNGARDYLLFSLSIRKEDNSPELIDFLAGKVAEICSNKEYKLLNEFVSELDKCNLNENKIMLTLAIAFENSDSLDSFYEMANELRFASDYYSYTNSGAKINKNTDFIASYIDKNGTEPVFVDSGTGFYADKEDNGYSHRVGLADSPLYDSEYDYYFGDFKVHIEEGVTVDNFSTMDEYSHYQEYSYSDYDYYFRDYNISHTPFDCNFGNFPLDGEYVYSGEFLFCFSSEGKLLGCYKLDW